MSKPRRAAPLSRFSEHFNLASKDLRSRGVFDPILDRDSTLSINPKLLDKTKAPELKGAHEDVLSHFDDIIRLLAEASGKQSVLWRSAYKLMDFPEFKGAALGFSARKGDGRGWPPKVRAETLDIGKELVDAGVRDPRIFELVGLFQDNVGADLVSDMLGTILSNRLTAYTERICKEVGVPTIKHEVHGKNRALPTYLNEKGERKYVVLVPEDVLSDLPQVLTRDDIGWAASHNEEIRRELNKRLGQRWKSKFQGSKAEIRRAILKSPTFVKELLKRYDRTRLKSYDFNRDRDDIVRWLDLAQQISAENPLTYSSNHVATESDAIRVVQELLRHFKHLVEHTRLQRALYTESGTPQKESRVQDIFFAIAATHSIFSGLDVSPEVNSGRGAVDFKFSLGRAIRIVVEMKLAKSSHLIDGYESQVREYKDAEEAAQMFYLVVDLGGPTATANLTRLKAAIDAQTDSEAPEVVICNAKQRPSASRVRRKSR